MFFVENFIKILRKNKINFFTGVPDSILKNLSKYLENYPSQKHVIATNEGAAVSIGIGHYLSKKKIPCVYLQNSGLGNAINPLISIAHKEVYSIPLLLIIGWRGSPNQPDEPQHKAKGKITKKLLNLLKIKHCVLRSEQDLSKLKNLIKYSYQTNNIIACLVEKNSIKIKKNKKINKDNFSLLRSDFLESLLDIIPKNSKLISTTGYTSRELMQIRKSKKKNRGKDFYMVGGMGHSSAVAAGYSIGSKNQVICLDGDGSILMHLGTMHTLGYLKNKNFKHVILNNSSHESVGCQPTYAKNIDFKKVSIGMGYKNFFSIKDKNNLTMIIKKFLKKSGPSLIEVKIRNKSLMNLLRPKNLKEIKKNFIAN
tara:strand:+ start:1849 stop:2952 length:1104 start_codon:yes stop_codon:yes gene_type:complete